MVFNIVLYKQAVLIPCPLNLNNHSKRQSDCDVFFFTFYPDVPGPPRNLEVEINEKTEVGLKWTAPESDGGSLVTGYTITIEKYDVNFNKWVTVNKTQVCFQLDVFTN